MKYILLVNPNGGKKRGPKILKQIKPLFDSHGIDLFIIETTFAGHAREIINQIDLSEFNGIIGIGGDGTLHEITNGLLSRKDPHILPIGIIPGGSGNSYMHDLDLTDPVMATKAIINGNTQLVDTIKIELNHITKYSMNMIGWGLVTDVGNKAEQYRWLGPSRYTILSIIEVLKYRTRQAKLVIENKEIEDEFTFIIACNSIHVGKGMQMAPKAKINDGLIDLVVVKSGASRARLLKVLPKLFNGSHILEPEVTYYQTSSFQLIPKKDEILNIDGEVIGTTPIKVNVIPNAIKIFY